MKAYQERACVACEMFGAAEAALETGCLGCVHVFVEGMTDGVDNWRSRDELVAYDERQGAETYIQWHALRRRLPRHVMAGMPQEALEQRCAKCRRWNPDDGFWCPCGDGFVDDQRLGDVLLVWDTNKNAARTSDYALGYALRAGHVTVDRERFNGEYRERWDKMSHEERVAWDRNIAGWRAGDNKLVLLVWDETRGARS